MAWYHLCKHTYEYTCGKVVWTQTEKELEYKIQDNERRKVNGTGEGIQRNFQVYLWLFFFYLKKSEVKEKNSILCCS